MNLQKSMSRMACYMQAPNLSTLLALLAQPTAIITADVDSSGQVGWVGQKRLRLHSRSPPGPLRRDTGTKQGSHDTLRNFQGAS